MSNGYGGNFEHGGKGENNGHGVLMAYIKRMSLSNHTTYKWKEKNGLP